MRSDLLLLSEYVATSWAKQAALADFLGEHSWDADLEAGTVDFGEDRVYPIQVLGTEGEQAQTWLWAWANPYTQLPIKVLADANRLREIGASQSIKCLIQPKIPLSDLTGHEIALLASGLCEADAYYRGPYDGGAVYFLIHHSPPGTRPQPNAVLIAGTLSSVISHFDVDHRIMVTSFLRQIGLAAVESRDRIDAITVGGRLEVTFDEAGRIRDIRTEVRPNRGI